MVELKVHCDCGQKYKFDVEPVSGRMPFTVNCPVCGVDGTERANALLAEMTSSGQDALSPATAVPETKRPRLYINQAALPSPPIKALRPAPGVKKERGKPSFAMGLLGGVLGVLMGSLVYYLVFKYTGLRIKLLALGVGALAGWWAELLGKGEGSNELGGITAALVVGGLVGTQYLVALSWWHENIPSAAFNSAYTNSVIKARAIVGAVSTGSDEEIRNYLAAQEARLDGATGTKPNPAAISQEDIKGFREKELTEARDLASGKMTHDQYNAIHNIDTIKEQSQDSDEATFKTFFMLFFMSKINLVSLVGAGALAYKMSTNA